MERCPDTSEIADLLAGRVDGPAADRLQDHLDGCAACFALVAELARVAATRTGDEPPAEAVAPSWRERRRLEEYDLVRPIGRGSGGQVWLARDTLLERDVAIKFLSTAAHPTARERFRIEARAIARLSHPNVVTVFRVGEVDDQPYLVSELIRGDSLDRVARPLPWPRVRELAVGLARGLAAAHRAGIVHRDLKPANAIVAESGEVKLLDFGLAKLDDDGAADAVIPAESLARAASTPALTATGHVLGTPLYMAPEAWRGERPTFAMDVFSLGAMLYELCAGRSPHDGGTLGDVRAAALGPPAPPLAAQVPGIDPAFAAVIARCLAHDPADRYLDGGALCAALERTIAPPPPPPRRRARAAIVAALALAAALVAGVAVIATRPSRSASARHALAPLAPQRCSADRWCWDASWVASLAGVWGARPDDVWAVGQSGAVRHRDRDGWTDVDAGTVADLFAVGGSAPDDVWIVGAWGTVLHRDARGWRELPSGFRGDLYAVWASSPRDAWAVGDGGATLHWDGAAWRAIPSATTQKLVRVDGRAPDDVWAAGFGGAVVHWDGAAWTAFDVASPTPLTGLYVAGPRDVWAVGFHSTIRHWDGAAWRAIAVPDVADPDPDRRADFPFHDVAGSGPDDVWLLGTRDVMLHWDGATWTRLGPGMRRELGNLHVFGRSDAWAIGVEGAIAHWDGAAWRGLGDDPPYVAYRAVWGRRTDDVWTAGYAVGADGRRVSRAQRWDGRAWRVVPMPDGPPLVAVGGAGGEVWFAGAGGAIRRWDGRRVAAEASPTTRTLRGLWAGAWAVGDGGTIARRTDGRWTLVDAPTTADLRAVWGARADDVWAVGDGGTIVRWQGAAWTPVASGTTADLDAIWGSGPADVWAVGDGGTALRWDGHAWTAVFSNFSENLSGVGGSAADDVWAASDSDRNVERLLHWNGAAWTADDRTPRGPLAAVWVGPGGEAWAVGNADVRLHHVP